MMDQATKGGRSRRTHDRWPRRPSRRTGDDGATLVEFAIIAPLLFALVLGIIDFGGAYNDWISMRQGTREGARQAVTGRVGESTSCQAFPTSDNTAVAELVCTVKDRADLPDERLRVKLVFEPSKNYEQTPSIKICTMAQIRSLSGFYSAILDGRVVRTEVQMKVEQRTTDVGKPALEPFEETPLSGQSWGFCQPEATS